MPADKLRGESWALAEKLERKAPLAVRFAKEVYRKSRWMEFEDAIIWEAAMAEAQQYFDKGEWVTKGIQQFKDKKYKPALQTYQRD